MEYLALNTTDHHDKHNDLVERKVFRTSNFDCFVDRALIIHGPAQAVDQIINATIDAAERGVDVRVITEEANKDNDLVAKLFGEHGIPVVWFKETWFAALHNKGMIVDGDVVYISSINFSDKSVTENREAGVIKAASAAADATARHQDTLCRRPIGGLKQLWRTLLD